MVVKEPSILLIDDEPQILRALKTILTANHFSIQSAVTGEQGIAMAVAQPPDLIILDLSLPDMDGIEVCRSIREWSRVPIIILSVRDREKEKVAALDSGADDYLTKPFGIEELLARIRVALRHAEHNLGNKESIINAGPVTVICPGTLPHTKRKKSTSPQPNLSYSPISPPTPTES